MPTGTKNYRGVEQLAARQAHNLEVVGSNPTPATKLPSNFIPRLGSSVVEQTTEFSVPLAVTQERKSGELEEA